VLGDMTPQEAVDTVFPTSAITGAPGFSQTDYDNMVQAVENGMFYQAQGWAGGGVQNMETAYCGISASPGASIAKVGTNLVATIGGVAIATAVGTVAAPFTLGLSLVGSLFVGLFTHHSQMVKKEQQLFCATLPAARDTLTAIENAVNDGTLTPAQGVSALEQLQTSFEQNLSSMLQMSANTCNAECIWVKQMRAIVAYLSSKWQDLAAAQAAAQPAQATVAAGTLALPSWWPIAAVVLVGFVLLRGL
jgi:hypothetical protein